MVKYPRRKIDDNERDRLLLEFCQALVEIKKPGESAEFLKDLLGPKELEMLAIRLQIAKSLINGMTYFQIRRALKVSQSTIARVAVWLDSSGEGFRMIVSRIGDVEIKPLRQRREWDSFKRKYPAYFWPELLIEEIVASSSKKQKQQMKRVLQTLRKSSIKPPLYRQLKKLL